jgi:hypothetical protein
MAKDRREGNTEAKRDIVSLQTVKNRQQGQIGLGKGLKKPAFPLSPIPGIPDIGEMGIENQGNNTTIIHT